MTSIENKLDDLVEKLTSASGVPAVQKTLLYNCLVAGSYDEQGPRLQLPLATNWETGIESIPNNLELRLGVLVRMTFDDGL